MPPGRIKPCLKRLTIRKVTPTERSLVTIAGRFANEMIAPIAERLERDKSALPASVVAEWIRLGMHGMQVSARARRRGSELLRKGRRRRGDCAGVLSVRFRTDRHAGRGHPN